MNLGRKYLQFNNLVIDGYEMLESADLSGSFKTETTAYTYGNGSYVPFKNKTQYSNEQNLSMTWTIDVRKLDCQQRRYYKDYLLFQISIPGKLWAIEADRMLWSYSYVADWSETYSTDRYKINIDVNLVIYEGFWHKANILNIFVQPYDICNFLGSEEFRNVQECYNYCGDTCAICGATSVNNICSCNCQCNSLDNTYSFCSMQKELVKAWNSPCGNKYKIIYDCRLGLQLYGDEQTLGSKICKNDICSGIISGMFYSDTILTAESVTVTIIGVLNDARIVFNGNVFFLNGEYNGRITITEQFRVYYLEDECCEETLLPIETITIPNGSTYGFEVNHGYNTIEIETNDCCSMTCIFIKVDAITI